MTLHIHHGPHLAPLTDSLATLLAAPLADPFASEVIAVPTAGVRDWLQQRLALQLGATGRSDGVSANIRMVFPNQFLRAALGQALQGHDAWDIDHLTWAVLTVLDHTVVDVPGYHGAAHGRGRYSTARRIADLFDRYANNRPELLQQWQMGHDGDGTLDDNEAVVPLPLDQLWQPALWRQVRELIAAPTQAERLADLLRDLRDGRLQPQLPQRVAVFGVSAIAPGQLSVLGALAHVRDVHVYLVHPSEAAWNSCRQQLAGKLTLRSACDATAAVQHPLLRSWARSSMEATALLGAFPAEQHLHGVPLQSSPVRPPSLLSTLQHDIRGDHRPSESIANAHDTSVQVHMCHGATRQLEVLRDALGHLFAADPTLAPHEVVVVCPDLPRFAPLVAPVFQRGSFPVPVQMSDLSLGADNPVAMALSEILAVVAGRCTASELLGLCSLAPIRQQFGMTTDDVALIDQWVTDLGTSWGLDSEHRSQWVPADITEGTWSATLDRLLLGAAMPSPSPRIGPSNIVPFDDMNAQSFRTAGILAELIARLRNARIAANGEHPIGEWVDIITSMISSLCATQPNDAWQLAQVLGTVAELRTQSLVRGEPCPVTLSLTDIRALLQGQLVAQTGRLTMRSGAVTVTTMVPLRNIPARVVCVLGLDEASLRATGGDGDDVLSTHPCVGERDARADGRQLMLDALMSAGEHFVITCDGNDITTNRDVPPPVQLAELFDLINATVGVDATAAAHSAVVRRHPRQAYDDSNFTATPAPFSFDDDMLRAAHTRRAAQVAPTRPAVLAPTAPATVTFTQLLTAVTRPSRTYLFDRVDARLPRQVSEIDDDIPLSISSLDTWRLGSDLLTQHRSPAGVDQLDQWRQAQRLAGNLPPQALADTALSTVTREVDLVLNSVADLRDLIRDTHSEAVDVALPCALVPAGVVHLRDIVTDIAEHTLIRVEFKRPAPAVQLAAALHLAALVVSAPSLPWQAVVVTRGKSSQQPKPKPTWFIPAAGASRVDAALHFLDTALSIRLQALREPLPLFERSSLSLYDTGAVEDEEFDRDLLDEATAFLWGHLRIDDIVEPIGDGRAESLADLLWSAFHAFVTSADQRAT